MRKLFRVALCAVAVHGVAIACPAIAYAQDESLPPLPVPAGEAPAAVPSGEATTEGRVPPAASTVPVVVSSPAPDPEPAASAPTEPPTRWYGYQTLGMDLLSGLVIAGGLAANSGGAFAVGVSMYAVGGPIVQAVHHRGYVTWLDLGIRLTAPLVGTFVGAIVGSVAGGAPGCGPDDDIGVCAGLMGAAIGFGVGTATAIAIDAAVFSRETVPAPATASRTSPATFDSSLAPMITMNRDDRRNLRPIVGIAGTF